MICSVMSKRSVVGLGPSSQWRWGAGVCRTGSPFLLPLFLIIHYEQWVCLFIFRARKKKPPTPTGIEGSFSQRKKRRAKNARFLMSLILRRRSLCFSRSFFVLASVWFSLILRILAIPRPTSIISFTIVSQSPFIGRITKNQNRVPSGPNIAVSAMNEQTLCQNRSSFSFAMINPPYASSA